MLKPINDRVIVMTVEKEETSRGGILLPDTAKEKPLKGKVLAIGPGKLLDNGKRQAMDVKVDDTVLYGKYTGTEVKVKGEEYLILRQDDILAVVK
jgi:chaperonin GroES